MQTFAQSVNAPCPPPLKTKIKSLCGSVILNEEVRDDELDYYSYGWEKRLWQLACADPKTDTPEEAKVKIKKMWDLYKTQFQCEQQENFLKFTYVKSYTGVVSHLVTEYGLDINFIDPFDNLNLYDFITLEYENSLIDNGSDHIKTQVYKGYLIQIINLGGTSAKSK